MKNRYFRILSLSLLVVLVAAAFPRPAYAQLGISSIQPASMQFGSGTTITVQGTDFVDGSSVVILEGYGALATTFQNSTVLTAVVPANVPVGVYDVTVSTGAATETYPGGFTINPLPPPTNTPPPFTRPQFAVYTSRLTGTVRTNSDVTLKVVMENVGLATAYNTQAAFTSTDLVPTKTGGIAIVGNVEYDKEVEVSQTFYVSGQISGAGVIVVDMTVSYYDSQGTAYSDKFTLSIPVTGATVPSGPAAPTATPTGVKSSQLVITGYASNVEPLQPGVQFALNLKVQNVGNANAQRITMIVGGGSSGGNGGGTPQPGGVSGGSGDFANFAPVGASNVQSLGDLKAGENVQAVQSLIVNVSTNPGAYPVRITFSYLNDKNEVVDDEQVITLLVYSLPNVDVSFYRPPDPFFAGQPSALPIQVVNIGKRSAVFGNIKIETGQGSIENGTSLVGSLEAGGYFTLDAMFIPDQLGKATLNFTIDYVDDFNEARTITRTIEVEVMESFIDPSLDPSLNGGGGDMGDGGFPPMTEETVRQKIWRFILGLFGLDSSSPIINDPGVVPPSEGVPVQPIPGKG
jgi:hypothetical protein